jgi:hypothetical protein
LRDPVSIDKKPGIVALAYHTSYGKKPEIGIMVQADPGKK